MKRIYCRACNACGLHEVLNLGHQPPSNALRDILNDDGPMYPLRLARCRACGLIQLDYDVPHSELFSGKYPFFSGSVPDTVRRAKPYADYMTRRLGLNEDSMVVEIGGNDGTVLKEFNTNKLNYELSEGPAYAAMKIGVPTVQARWCSATYLRQQADLIYANNVFAHDPEPQEFVKAIAENLVPGGTFSAQFPWALHMIKQCQFDTVYHEHYCYFTLRALMPLFAEWGLQIYDAEEASIHGGTLQILVCHAGKYAITSNVQELLNKEREAELDDLETYWRFREKAFSIRADFEVFLTERAPIYAYGAAAKGSTFLNWARTTNSEVLAVGDTTPAKIGKYLPGSGIPIISEAALLAKKPEYVLILPWNWSESIVDRLHCIRGWGGQFVTAMPELKVF